MWTCRNPKVPTWPRIRLWQSRGARLREREFQFRRYRRLLSDPEFGSTAALLQSWVLASICWISFLELRSLLQTDAIRLIPTRHVGEDNGVALVQAFENLNRIHGFPSHLYGHTRRFFAVRIQLEQTDRAVFLPKRGTPHIENVVHAFQ